VKIIYLHSFTKDVFNNAFKEIVDGLKFNGVTVKKCPEKIDYKTIKGHDVIILDSLHIYRKKLKYSPIIVDKRVHTLKKGIFTMDFWIDLYSKGIINWIHDNKINDFVIFRHSSGLQLFERKFKLFKKAIETKFTHDKFDIRTVCLDFKNAIFSPFTINSDVIKKTDKLIKKYDICFGGHMCVWYPLREKIFKSVVNSNKFLYLDPVWRRADDAIKLKDKELSPYYKGIAQSWLSLATTGLANISTRKHYEICGLGSTCLGNHTGLFDHDIVKKNIVEIDIKMSENQICNKIEDALSDKNKLNYMVESTREKILSEFDYRNVGKNLVKDLEKLYD